MFNGIFWRNYFHREFIPSTQRVVDVFLDRLMPTFSDLEAEADAHQQKLWDDIVSQPFDPNVDESKVAEAVSEAGVEYYLGLKGMEQGILNCSALFLYHLFEQHLMMFHRKEVLRYFEQDEISLVNPKTLRIRLHDVGIDISSFEAWPKLEELRLLANSLKHGEGESSRKLANVMPDIFKPPSYRKSEGYEFFSRERIYAPLLGEDLYVTADDVKEYQLAIESFWNELANRLTQGEGSES